jgi:hypothetical protein
VAADGIRLRADLVAGALRRSTDVSVDVGYVMRSERALDDVEVRQA